MDSMNSRISLLSAMEMKGWLYDVGGLAFRNKPIFLDRGRVGGGNLCFPLNVSRETRMQVAWSCYGFNRRCIERIIVVSRET